jgi:hypothetical protein
VESLGFVFSNGLSPHSLRDHDGSKLRCWVCPAFDAQGCIIGLSKRFEDGKKKTHHGGHLGLFLPKGWRERAEQTGVLYAVESPSDTAACVAGGLAAVGRPSNTADLAGPALL